MKHIQGIDGLRALAVLAVVGVHCGVPGFAGGSLGVDVFFVLSGYLITRLLVETRPTLPQFYLRRFTRLMPALVLMLAGYLAVYPILHPEYPHHLRDALLALFYLTDYSELFRSGALHTPNFIPHTWSLSVEEHFYLAWPLVLYRFRPSVRALVAAYAVAVAWHWLWFPGHASYFRFDTRLSGLILGCIIAHVPRDRFPAWPGLVVLAAGVASNTSGLREGYFAGMTVMELAAAVAVLGTAPAWLSARVPVLLGKWSYGIYLWHVLFMYALQDVLAWPALLACVLGGSVAMAAFSFYTVEAIARQRPKLVAA